MTETEDKGARAPFKMHVELGKIREFARATKSKNPEYLGDEEPVAPTTFLCTAGFWMPEVVTPAGDGGSGYERILHGGTEYTFYGPPPKAGTVLYVTQRPGPSWEKTGRRGGAMKFSESIMEYRDEAGNLVAETRNTVIETEQAPTMEAGA
ncbi:MAG: MaoC family dehydratase N-terminal domain-containing protein [Acidimicrobiales bacterium]